MSAHELPTIVLVHGGWHGAWCFDELRQNLQQRGVNSVAVELTSHGADGSDLGGLEQDVKVVHEALVQVKGDAVLLGHSYGGMVITQAALKDGAAAPTANGRVVELIYAAAFLPDVGESVGTITGGGQPPWMSVGKNSHHVAEGWATKLFYSDTPAEIAAQAEGRLDSQSLQSFADTVGEAGWRDVHTTYVVCTSDRSLSPDAQYRWAGRVDAQIEFDSDHSPFLSRPGGFAELLVGVLNDTRLVPL